MNNSIKVLLTINLEGGTLVRKSTPEHINFLVKEKDLCTNKKWRGKDGLKVVRKGETLHYPLIAKPAVQQVKINIEAYNYMISAECPPWCHPKMWPKLTKKARLEKHLGRICEHHKGKSFIYEILED